MAKARSANSWQALNKHPQSELSHTSVWCIYPIPTTKQHPIEPASHQSQHQSHIDQQHATQRRLLAGRPLSWHPWLACNHLQCTICKSWLGLRSWKWARGSRQVHFVQCDKFHVHNLCFVLISGNGMKY